MMMEACQGRWTNTRSMNNKDFLRDVRVSLPNPFATANEMATARATAVFQDVDDMIHRDEVTRARGKHSLAVRKERSKLK